MRFLIVMIVWCFSSLAFMISSILFGFFQDWYVFVFLVVYFLLVMCGLPNAVRKDNKRLISDERGEYY